MERRRGGQKRGGWAVLLRDFFLVYALPCFWFECDSRGASLERIKAQLRGAKKTSVCGVPIGRRLAESKEQRGGKTKSGRRGCKRIRKRRTGGLDSESEEIPGVIYGCICKYKPYREQDQETSGTGAGWNRFRWNHCSRGVLPGHAMPNLSLVTESARGFLVR